MTVNEMIKKLMELKEAFNCGNHNVSMCVGTDENFELVFRDVKHVTLNVTVTETDAGVIVWGS
jgi:hypothetical protein